MHSPYVNDRSNTTSSVQASMIASLQYLEICWLFSQSICIQFGRHLSHRSALSGKFASVVLFLASQLTWKLLEDTPQTSHLLLWGTLTAKLWDQEIGVGKEILLYTLMCLWIL